MMKKLIGLLICVILIFNTYVCFADEEYGAEELEFKQIYIDVHDPVVAPSTSIQIQSFSEAGSSVSLLTEIEEEFPESYRSEYVSPIKNQRGSGNCWIFSTMGALEGFMLKNYPVYDDEGNLKTDAYDFSENHMQYMVSNLYNNTEFGHNMGIGTAGHAGKSIPYFLNRRGPVNDTDDEFVWPAVGRDFSQSANVPLSDYVVTGMTLVTGLDYADACNYSSVNKQAMIKLEKKLIMEYGSVVCTVNASTANYVDTKKANLYYAPPSSSEDVLAINHSVLAVGWDDTYSRENFKRTVDGVDIMPDGDGAFIIKNSHGTSVGDEGYFYLSYFDYYASHDLTAITGMKPRDNSEILYSHDDFFPYSSVAYGNSNEPIYSLMFGNQFERNANNEILTDVSLYAVKGSQYDVYLIDTEMLQYGNYEGIVYFENMSENTTKVYDGFIPECSGYYTIDVDDKQINSDKFSIMIVAGTLDGSAQPLPIETNVLSMQVNNAVQEEFQSFFNFYYTDYPDYMYDYYGNIIVSDSEENKYTILGNAPVKAITKTTDKYSDISFINYTDENKKEKTVFNEGDTVNIAAVVDGANLENTTLVCGIYKENKLIKVLDKAIGNKENIFVYENIPADFADYTVRVFALDNYNNLKPLGNVITKGL